MNKNVKKAMTVFEWLGITSVLLTGIWLLAPGLLNWLYSVRLWFVGMNQVIGLLVLVGGGSAVASKLKK